ncbi:MAG: hypothetical protein GC172_06045 [Phycisphaera sp.]|nr:hypothetical protein [Phycisphaera sp.]
MRAFWVVLALLATAGVLFVVASPARESGRSPEPTPPPSPARSNEPTPTNDSKSPSEPSNEQPSDPPDASSQSTQATEAVAPASAPFDPLALLLPPAPPAAQVKAPAPNAAPNAASAPRPPATDTRSPAEVTRRIDARTLELDGRFRIIGNGGEDDPYRINWELLTSAGAFVDPAQNALTPPPWVRALDGVWVEISAYYSTPVRVSSTKSVLLTLNRWDGCCLGLPPTPFDAIDTSLASTLELRGVHLFRFGTFRGRLEVEPFTAGPYLLGLYRLEDATFEGQ